MPPPDDRKMRPTNLSTLVVAGLAMAALSWLAISRFYGDFPTIPVLPGMTLLALAALEGVAAVNTKNRIDRKPGMEPVDPLLVARYLVLAKASSLAAALFTGLYAGLTVWLLTEQGRLTQAEEDLVPAVVGTIGGFTLVLSALFLERACRVPPPPRDPSDQRTEPDADREAGT